MPAPRVKKGTMNYKRDDEFSHQFFSVFNSHILESVAEYERDGVEEIRFSRTVSSPNQVVFRTERINLQTITITLESTYYHLLDVHPISLSLSLCLLIFFEIQTI